MRPWHPMALPPAPAGTLALSSPALLAAFLELRAPRGIRSVLLQLQPLLPHGTAGQVPTRSWILLPSRFSPG